MEEYKTIPCTACGYCVADCPKNVDIPQIFKRYNDNRQFDDMARFDIDYFAFIPERRRADQCISCGKCTRQCPQKIDIPAELRRVHSFVIGEQVGVDMETVKTRLKRGSKLVCFGAGAIGRNVLGVIRGSGIAVDYFCDNDEKLWGTQIDRIPVLSPQELQKLSNAQVMITSGHRSEIAKQLREMRVEYYE